MRELIADLFVTLDGYAYGEGAPGYFGYCGPELGRRIDENVATPQVTLMGRKTYEMMWAIVRDQPVEGADRMNELPKVVFSGTLEEPLEWNNSRLVKADLVDELRSLKAEGGDPLRTIGSLSVVKSLMGAGLVDRLRLFLFPQILGETGREWIFDGLPDIDLQLVGTDVLNGRLVVLEYHPANADPTDLAVKLERFRVSEQGLLEGRRPSWPPGDVASQLQGLEPAVLAQRVQREEPPLRAA